MLRYEQHCPLDAVVPCMVRGLGRLLLRVYIRLGGIVFRARCVKVAHLLSREPCMPRIHRCVLLPTDTPPPQIPRASWSQLHAASVFPAVEYQLWVSGSIEISRLLRFLSSVECNLNENCRDSARWFGAEKSCRVWISISQRRFAH